MKADPLKQFVVLKQSLLKERAELESRLAGINRVLGSEARLSAAVAVATAPAVVPNKPKRSKRVHNSLTLDQAVRKVTTPKALTRRDILSSIEKMGYKFRTKNPANSLSTLLYTKHYKNSGGKFSPP